MCPKNFTNFRGTGCSKFFIEKKKKTNVKMPAKKLIEVLGQGFSLYKWIADLQSALVRRRRIGHVFHDIYRIKQIVSPAEPVRYTSTNKVYSLLMREYEDNLVRFQERETEAHSILALRIERAICPFRLVSVCQADI